MIACKHCKGVCRKDGCQKDGSQRYRCKACGRRQQLAYRNQAYVAGMNSWIVSLVKESCGICGMARLLKVAINNVTRRVKSIAAGVKKLPIPLDQKKVEVDELKTYVGSKQNDYWIAYALTRETGEVIDYKINKRTKLTLQGLIQTLLLARAKRIYTDNLQMYRTLIPRSTHGRGSRRIIHIERYSLNLRIHLRG